MGINKQEMSTHLVIMRTLSNVNEKLGKHLRVTYKKKLFKNTYNGRYFTHCYELYLNTKYVTTIYDNQDLLRKYYIEDIVRSKLKVVCRLKRKKKPRKYVRF